MKIISFLRSLHAWGGFVLALLILLVSITGSALVWKKEYLWLTEPVSRSVMEITPELATTVASAAEAQFGDEVLLLAFGYENLGLHKVFLPGSNYALLDNTGALVDQWYLNDRPEEWLYDLHHRLLLGNTGLMIVGIAALAMVLLVFVGLIVWWPARSAFNWRLWVAGWGRSNLLATHRNIGILTALPACVLLITGAMLSFPTQTEELLLEDYRRTEACSNLYTEELDELSGPEHGDWLSAFSRAQASFPGGTIRSVRPPAISSYRLIGTQQAGDWNQSGLSLLYIDADRGYMDMRLNAGRLPAVEQLYNLGSPLHTAKVDRLWYRITVFIFGVGLCVLSFLGLVSFTKKLRGQK
ncbi:MAG: PepSY domain-containing protein [Proteobacteria bacterium]|nr:PepSY domain-containing protein [Pseudomonadota bacterium]